MFNELLGGGFPPPGRRRYCVTRKKGKEFLCRDGLYRGVARLGQYRYCLWLYIDLEYAVARARREKGQVSLFPEFTDNYVQVWPPVGARRKKAAAFAA